MEEIVVVGLSPLIDPSSTEIGGNITHTEIETLPTERDYRHTISFLPQANTSYLGDEVNIAGSTGSENSYIIDGVNVSDPYMATNSTRLPMNFVKEIEVKAGGYQAEFARSLGGVVNVITPTGTNHFRGQVFGFLANSNFAADNRRGTVELEQQDFARYDVGFNIGGPVARDKLWYFLAYDPSFENENLVLPGFGAFEDKLTRHQFAGKLTWQAGTNTTFDLTVFGDPSKHDRVGANWLGQVPSGVTNPDPLLGKWEQGGTTVAVNGQHLIGDNFIIDMSVSRFDMKRKAEPLTEIGWNEQMVIDEETDIWSGGYQNIFDFRSTRTAARLVGTWHLDSHKLKAGFEYENNKLDSYWQWATPDGQDGVIIRNNATDFISLYLLVDNEINSHVPSVFLQDSWRAGDRLRINAGMRWDGFYSRGSDGQKIMDINGQFQPRLGFTFQLDGSDRNKLFGSVGRFYEQMPNFTPGLGAPKTQYVRFYDADPQSGADPTMVLDWSSDSIPVLDELKGQHSDEVVLGYERRLGSQWIVGLKGIYRELRAAIEGVWYPEGTSNEAIGNPGFGTLDFFPKPVRKYHGLQLEMANVEKTGHYHFTASYVLSRTYGNYPGTFDHDTGIPNPHGGSTYDVPALLENATGRLPNDRPHAFKFYGSYRLASWFSTGGFFTWQSGTPLSEFGYLPPGWPYYIHLRDRGTFGRTPSIWDLNLRLAFTLPATMGGSGSVRPRLLLDVFHLFSQRTGVAFDQQHYLAVDNEGNQTTENPNFGKATRYQPAMALRIGIEMNF